MGVMNNEVEILPPRPLDTKILALADSSSPEEIADRLGRVVSAKAVAARIQELLKARRWLTEAQRDQLITIKMSNILSTLESRFQDVENMTLQLKILKELGNRLDKRQAATQADLNSYDENVGRVLGRVVDMSLSYMKGALREVVDPDKWDELQVEAMEHARLEIAKHEVEA